MSGRIIVSIFAASVLGCGHGDSAIATNHVTAAGPSGGASHGSGGFGGYAGGKTGAGGLFSAGGGGGGSDLDAGPITDTHVDAGGDCAPDAGMSDWVACCNDLPCRGWCYPADAGGELFCNCGQPPWGVLGGCPEGTVCCGMNGCVAPGHCHEPGH